MLIATLRRSSHDSSDPFFLMSARYHKIPAGASPVRIKSARSVNDQQRNGNTSAFAGSADVPSDAREVRSALCVGIRLLLSATTFWVYFAILVILRITEMPDGSEVTNEAIGSEARGVFPHGRG